MQIFSGEHSMTWLFLSTVSRSNFNLECWFFAEGGKPGGRTPIKTFRARRRTNNIFKLLVTSGRESNPGHSSGKTMLLSLRHSQSSYVLGRELFIPLTLSNDNT